MPGESRLGTNETRPRQPVLEPGTLARVSRGRQSPARMRIRLGSLQAPVDKSVKNLRRGERETA